MIEYITPNELHFLGLGTGKDEVALTPQQKSDFQNYGVAYIELEHADADAEKLQYHSAKKHRAKVRSEGSESVSCVIEIISVTPLVYGMKQVRLHIKKAPLETLQSNSN